MKKLFAVALLLFGIALGFLFLVRPALEKKQSAEESLSTLQSGVSTKTQLPKQLQKNPSQEDFIRFVQKVAGEESVRITNLSWKGEQLQIESRDNPARIAALATRISKSVSLDKRIKIKGPGAFPVSMSSNFLPRTTLTIDSLYSLSK